jgi:hypothetical protein
MFNMLRVQRKVARGHDSDRALRAKRMIRRESADYANLKTARIGAKIWAKNLVHFHLWG